MKNIDNPCIDSESIEKENNVILLVDSLTLNNRVIYVFNGDNKTSMPFK